MHIKINNNSITLKELIENDNISSGVVEYRNYKLKDTMLESEYSLYVNKFKSSDNLNVVTYTRLYGSDMSKEKVSLENIGYSLLFFYDNDIKTVLVDGFPLIFFNGVIDELKSQLPDYKFLDLDDAYFNIYEMYVEKVNDIMDSKFPELMKLQDYSTEYNKTLKNSVRNVEIDYINKVTEYKLSILIPKDLDSCKANTVQESIKNPKFLTDHIEKHVKELIASEYNRISHARNMAYRKLMKDLTANPSEFVINRLQLLKAIENVGKTLTVVTDDATYKVENNIIRGYYFNTTDHKDLVYLDNIKKILYRNKIIYDITEAAVV